MPDVLDPIIHIDARTRLYGDIRRKLFPAEVRGILAGALQGDLFWQERLFATMCDSWPRLQKNLRELTQAVSRIRFEANPFTVKGSANPTSTALAKAEMVDRALGNLDPIPTRVERGFEGLVKDVASACLMGITVSEVLWEMRDGEFMPRAFVRLPARFYRYPIEVDATDELLLNPKGDWDGLNLTPFPENQFVVSIYQGHSGHPSVSAPMRCLSACWVAATFGMEWFCQHAQLFGIPFRKGTFEKGDTEGYALLCQMLAQMGTAGWAALPHNTNLEFISAAGGGGVGPAERLLDTADRICDIMILGQTLSTDTGPVGSRALGQVHAGVKQDILEGVADFTAQILSRQLSHAVIALNYGPNPTEVPVLEAHFDTPADELTLAQRDLILFQQLALPCTLSYLYTRHGVPEPEEGEALFVPPAPVLGGDGTSNDPASPGGAGPSDAAARSAAAPDVP